MASSSNNSPSFKIILGSSSPARRAILSNMGYQFTTKSADIDERAIRREKPEELVKAIAEAKADAIKLNLVEGCGDGDFRDRPTLLITSDQGAIRERPRSTEEATEFIRGYSGDRAFAVNYVLVTNLSTGGTKGGWDIPEICFHHIPHEFIEEIVKERDMTCVAGGLKLTHPSVLPFIKELVSRFTYIQPTAPALKTVDRLQANQLNRSDSVCHFDVYVPLFAQVGTADSVRGLPRELTEKLIRESLEANS
ncbi:7-methyl-GTP pyrophosphatase-like isoform X2 [Triticum dicoccoides]|uniref:7-methyl-GTP pyrophosphatase-like isoform X2 n=1 Tax=Triticum dicoccoides TaxID=85692 RepID=UPI00189095DC|nr:7-methyl-GTP pyrophosphatase-like isoform X2 [Triticum dicoccoides]